MATIVKPQVLVFQEFQLVPSEIVDPLRPHIAGPNAQLHRYTNAAEKALIYVGEYDHRVDTAVPWPGRQAGSKVDTSYVRLYIDNARMLYFEDLIGDTAGGRGTNTVVAGRNNWIRNSMVNFRANGAAYPRSALLGDRDVQVGDVVYIRGVTDPDDDCEEVELWTYVTGFAADQGTAVVQACRPATTNQASTEAAATITKIAGADNCVTATVDGTAYNGLASGDVNEEYTLEVIRSSINGCTAARLLVTSASGRDDVAEVVVADFGSPTAIGTRGLTVTFNVVTDPACEADAAAAGVVADQLIAGQKWKVTVSQAYEQVCCEAGGTYTGPSDDVYLIEVTKGGTFADLPEITVTTTKGLDYSGPTPITAYGQAVPIGRYGVTFKVLDCYGNTSSAPSSEPFGGDGNLVHGLRKGDKFYITVNTAASGPIRTLMLRHDIPASIRNAEDLDLRLFIEKNIEVSQQRLSSPPLVNYTAEATQMVVKAGITAYDPTWTHNGIEQPMPVESGKLYVHYREWLADLSDEVNFIDDIANIDAIPGQLDEDNPLKWGVYRALQNSRASSAASTSLSCRVAYTAVSDPDSLASWQAVLERIDGRDDIYNLIPLTFDREVHNLWQAHVENESTPEAGNWKAMIVPLLAKTEKMVVGQSTSTDGEVVMATVEDDPNASQTQYTRMSVPAGNAGFITRGVRAGDIVRYLFTVDAWGAQSYQEFVVDQVLSEDTLLLLEGLDEAIDTPQKVEIWHRLEKNEVIADLKAQAQSFADRRVVAVWPDYVGTVGNSQAGYFLCAALGGLIGSVAPHQPLTNIEVKGFDDYSRTYQLFSETQIDDLDDAGVWIVTEDRDGTPHTRHALTTDTTDVNSREEMIRRNVDSISYLFLRRLRPFIGRTNVTPSMLDKLRAEVRKTILFLKSNNFTQELGSQLIDGTIRSLYIHPLLADRVVIVVDLQVPAPLNNIELHLVV